MKISRLRVRNYRSIEDVELTFPSYFAAISGKNNSGKTNVLRAIRTLLRMSDHPFFFHAADTPSVKDDYPKWKSNDKEKFIEIAVTLDVYADQDEGLHNFITTYLGVADNKKTLTIEVTTRYTTDEEERVTLKLDGVEYDKLKSEEVASKLQTSKVLLLHNSTELDRRYPREYGGFLNELAISSAEQIDKLKDRIDKAFSKSGGGASEGIK